MLCKIYLCKYLEEGLEAISSNSVAFTLLPTATTYNFAPESCELVQNVFCIKKNYKFYDLFQKSSKGFVYTVSIFIENNYFLRIAI